MTGRRRALAAVPILARARPAGVPLAVALAVVLLVGGLSGCGDRQDPGAAGGSAGGSAGGAASAAASSGAASGASPSSPGTRSSTAPADVSGPAASAQGIEDAVSQAQATLDQLDQELAGDAAEANG